MLAYYVIQVLLYKNIHLALGLYIYQQLGMNMQNIVCNFFYCVMQIKFY